MVLGCEKKVPCIFELVWCEDPVAQWLSQSLAIEKTRFDRCIPILPIGVVWFTLRWPRPLVSFAESNVLEGIGVEGGTISIGDVRESADS